MPAAGVFAAGRKAGLWSSSRQASSSGGSGGPCSARAVVAEIVNKGTPAAATAACRHTLLHGLTRRCPCVCLVCRARTPGCSCTRMTLQVGVSCGVCGGGACICERGLPKLAGVVSF
jgi:hypothetical protein